MVTMWPAGLTVLYSILFCKSIFFFSVFFFTVFYSSQTCLIVVRIRRELLNSFLNDDLLPNMILTEYDLF